MQQQQNRLSAPNPRKQIHKLFRAYGERVVSFSHYGRRTKQFHVLGFIRTLRHRKSRLGFVNPSLLIMLQWLVACPLGL
jgi:hypothetical protein